MPAIPPDFLSEPCPWATALTCPLKLVHRQGVKELVRNVDGWAIRLHLIQAAVPAHRRPIPAARAADWWGAAAAAAGSVAASTAGSLATAPACYLLLLVAAAAGCCRRRIISSRRRPLTPQRLPLHAPQHRADLNHANAQGLQRRWRGKSGLTTPKKAGSWHMLVNEHTNTRSYAGRPCNTATHL